MLYFHIPLHLAAAAICLLCYWLSSAAMHACAAGQMGGGGVTKCSTAKQWNRGARIQHVQSVVPAATGSKSPAKRFLHA